MEGRAGGRLWLRLVVFAVVANPITLVGACSASFGMADAGNSLLQEDLLVIYETWTYRFGSPEVGDRVAAEHPEFGVDLVGTVESRGEGELVVTASYMRPGGSVASTGDVMLPEEAIEGRVIGSLTGSGDEDLAAWGILVAPWVLGFVMLCVAISWAERIRRRGEGSSRWFPLPLLLWGLGTAFYAWMMRNAAEEIPS